MEWIDFLIYIVPTLVLENLEQHIQSHNHYSRRRRHALLNPFRALVCLSKACAISLQWELDGEDVREVER